MYLIEDSTITFTLVCKINASEITFVLLNKFYLFYIFIFHEKLVTRLILFRGDN